MKRTSKTRRKLRRRKRGGNGNKISSPQLTRRKRSNLLWLISPAYRRLSSKIDKAKRRKGVIQQVQKEAKARGLIISKRQIREDLKTLPQNMQHHSDHLLDVYLFYFKSFRLGVDIYSFIISSGYCYGFNWYFWRINT